MSSLDTDMTPYTVVQTEDSSLTLERAFIGGLHETMHSRAGALGESLHVYGYTINQAKALMDSLKILSVGMGLGYVEWIVWAQELIGKSNRASLSSFEVDETLRLQFKSWLQGEECGALGDIFQHVMVSVADAYDLNFILLKNCGKEAYGEGRWVFEGDVVDRVQVPLSHRFNCVMYDAYSSKHNSILWQEDFLARLSHHCFDDRCVFATYASNSILKKTLIALGFDIHSRKGFGPKRECTFARRGF